MGAIATSSGPLSRGLKMQRALVDNRSIRYTGPPVQGAIRTGGAFVGAPHGRDCHKLRASIAGSQKCSMRSVRYAGPAPAGRADITGVFCRSVFQRHSCIKSRETRAARLDLMTQAVPDEIQMWRASTDRLREDSAGALLLRAGVRSFSQCKHGRYLPVGARPSARFPS